MTQKTEEICGSFAVVTESREIKKVVVIQDALSYYDKDKKTLHWAKEIKFGQDSINTLNYNIRILGRKGVMVLNAIAPSNALDLVQKDINKVLNSVQFNEGYQYDDFDSSVRTP